MVWVENFVEIKVYSRGFIKGLAGLGWAPTLRLFARVQFWRGLRVVAITLTARVKFIWPDHTEPTKCFAPRVTAPSIPGGNVGGTGGAK